MLRLFDSPRSPCPSAYGDTCCCVLMCGGLYSPNLIEQVLLSGCEFSNTSSYSSVLVLSVGDAVVRDCTFVRCDSISSLVSFMVLSAHYVRCLLS